MNTFDEKTHSYLIDGNPATGITTIISVLAKPALIQWSANEAVKYIREKMVFYGNYSDNGEAGEEYIVRDNDLEQAKTAHRKKKEDAGIHGTDTHALVEEYINKCLEIDGKPFTRGTNDPIHKFTEWANENVDHFLFSERRMYNKELFIAGTADFAYVGKDGKKYMGDFKTSSGIYGIDYWLQVAGYRLLAESEGDEPYDGSTVVRLGKKGDFEAQNRYDYETDKEAFLACLKLYRAQATFKK